MRAFECPRWEKVGNNGKRRAVAQSRQDERGSFHLDEPWQDIRELDVYDVDGEQIGSVKELYVEFLHAS